MDSDLLSLIILIGIGVFFLLGMFVLPYRKLQEEKNQTPLHTERFSLLASFWGRTCISWYFASENFLLS